MTGGAAERAASEIETVGLTKMFGSFCALNDVSIKVRPGTFHAILGENGAGKSTLVKCIMGYHTPSSGQLMVNNHEVIIDHPRDAHALGMGMVYQHFTLVPSLTAAENLVISHDDTPFYINWKQERERLDAFMAAMPFQVSLDQTVNRLSAGEKQKLELLKQLYLGRKFLVLDEPTSVLTPGEADDLLGIVRQMTVDDGLTVMMITHKFREVEAFADSVSVLRRGEYAGGGVTADFDRDSLTHLLIGDKSIVPLAARSGDPGKPVLVMKDIKAPDRSGLKSIMIEELNVRAGEIVGIAGVSGNGQFELVETLAGQRPLLAGQISINGAPFHARRDEEHLLNVRIIPEEPLRNACAPQMSVAENLAFRNFDIDADGKPLMLLQGKAMREQAEARIRAFNIKTSGLHAPMASLSGGNVQRAVLARELSGATDVLIVSNPCFGLDIAAVSEIRSRIMAARNAGAAVLLLSEDLDEILELSDRILVMAEGRLVFETPGNEADIAAIGANMTGHA